MKTKYWLMIGAVVLILSITILLNIPQETMIITELPPIKLPAIVIP